MIHHIIVKWNSEADKTALANEVKNLFAEAVEIEGVHGAEIKENVVPRENRYDIMIAVSMDKDALPVWDNSNLHKKWKNQYGSMIEKKCIFDCE